MFVLSFLWAEEAVLNKNQPHTVVCVCVGGAEGGLLALVNSHVWPADGAMDQVQAQA